MRFCSGIVLSLVTLGIISGLFGKIYGQLPGNFSKIVALIAILMGLNLLGVLKINFPNLPNLDSWIKTFPKPLAPIAAGYTFGLASSPCTTPVLAVLLAWIAKSGNPITGILLLFCFGTGQIIPLLIAGTAAASLQSLLALRSITQWIPTICGFILLITGFLSILSTWI